MWWQIRLWLTIHNIKLVKTIITYLHEHIIHSQSGKKNEYKKKLIYTEKHFTHIINTSFFYMLRNIVTYMFHLWPSSYLCVPVSSMFLSSMLHSLVYFLWFSFIFLEIFLINWKFNDLFAEIVVFYRNLESRQENHFKCMLTLKHVVL